MKAPLTGSLHLLKTLILKTFKNLEIRFDPASGFGGDTSIQTTAGGLLEAECLSQGLKGLIGKT